MVTRTVYRLPVRNALPCGDHKPLVSLLSTKKNLDELSPRIQRYRMRLMRYTYSIAHVPGKTLVTADALSRAPRERPLTAAESQFLDEVTAQAELVVSSIPATERRLAEVRDSQQQDEVCRQVAQYCLEGWPSHPSLPSVLRPYWQVQGELTIQNGLLLKGTRLAIPAEMRLTMLEKLHEGYQGVVKCRSRAQSSVWWPGLSRQLEELVRNCSACAMERRNPSEPMMASEAKLRPWQKVGTDMFFFKRATYLLVVDYCSIYVEIAKLDETTSSDVILHLRSIFARHGIPEVVVSDNGPQYAGHEFARFAERTGCTHITSSPRYPQSNGKLERAVQTVKNLLKKASDPYAALLAYRATALECGYSPAQLSMGRQLRTSLPVMEATLQPRWDDTKSTQRREMASKRQTEAYDRYNRVRPLNTLQTGDTVWVQDAKTGGTVVGQAGSPRSYFVQTPTSRLRRNRRHLVPTPNAQVEPTENDDVDDPSVTESDRETRPHALPTATTQASSHTTQPLAPQHATQPRLASPRVVRAPVVTRSGRTSVPPQRLDL